MKKFMVSILISGMDDKTMEALRPEEGKVMMKWALTGILIAPYVKEDLSGAYLVMRGKNLQHINTLMKTLPMYPYMKFEITELEKSPFVMRLVLGIFLRVGSLVKIFI